MANVLSIGVAIFLAWFIKFVVQKWMALEAARKSLASCPGGWILPLHPFRTLALALGRFFPLRGSMGYYFAKFSLYKERGSTVLSSVIFSKAQPIYWLADGDAIKTVSNDRVTFPKDTESYETMNVYGHHVIGTEGAEWKRHRSVANSAFNEANNALVWRETVRVIHEWSEDIDASEDKTRDLLHDLTLVTLLVISAAAFGQRASFSNAFRAEPPLGHSMPFVLAVTNAVSSLIPRGITPDWISALSRRIYLPILTPVLEKAEESFEETRWHMLEVVSTARSWIIEGKKANMDAALLRNLVEANMASQDSQKKLSDDELLSNTFNFLLAGHETTSHTLCFALVLLALHPDVQQKVYEETCRLWPNSISSPESSTVPHKEAIPRLDYTLAVFNETLRLFPPAARLAKHVSKDATLKARRFSMSPDGKVRNVEEYPVHVKAGDMVLIDMFALHMNPVHWGHDAAEFRPERFIDTDTYRWPREGFNAFASGPRSCIGQRFAVTEALCALSHLVRRYEILIPHEYMGKTHDELKELLLQWSPGLTVTPKNARVRLSRRDT